MNSVLIALTVLAVWLFLVIFQLSDLFASLVDVRGARDRATKARQARRHATELIWTIPFVTLLGLVLGLGVDVAGRLFFEWGELAYGLLLLVVLAFVAVAGGLGIVYLIIRREVPDYGTLRADLLGVEGERVRESDVAGFQADLGEADARQRHILLRFGRVRVLRGLQVELEELSARLKSVAPGGLKTVRVIPWSTANRVFWRASTGRLFVFLVSLVPFVVLLLAMTILSDWSGWLILLAFLAPPLISYALGITGARVSLASKVAWHAVNRKQREEVVQLLTELERSSRKGVAGLGDRVARALQILRQQQE